MTRHSEIPPSSVHRRMLCPGSRELESTVIEEFSNYAQEGTLAHTVAASLLEDEILPENATTEMVENAKEYVKIVRENHDEKTCSPIFVENSVSICLRSSVSDSEIVNFGTPDAFYFSGKRNILRVFDYKYGYKTVEAKMNWQMIYYAIGILQSHRAICSQAIELTIVQPRINHVSTWSISREELNSYENLLYISELTSLKENALLKVNHLCFTCKARSICPALRKATLNTLHEAELPIRNDLSSQSLSIEIQLLEHMLDLAKCRLSALEQEALSRLNAGNIVPNYTIEHTASRTMWKYNSDLTELKNYAELFDCQIEKPIEFITPLQAIKKGLPEELVDKYSERKRGEPKLKYIKNTADIFKNTID